jgi:hypothetical protein
MENISSFIRACRALNIGGGGGPLYAAEGSSPRIVDRASVEERRESFSNPPVLFEIAHLRNQPQTPEGLDRVLATLAALRTDLSAAAPPPAAGPAAAAAIPAAPVEATITEHRRLIEQYKNEALSGTGGSKEGF